MQYFNEYWLSPDITDEESNKISRSYWEYIQENKYLFPAGLQVIAVETSLHDGLFVETEVSQSEGRIKISLIVGDLQKGYEDLVIEYSGIDFSKFDLAFFKTLASSSETKFLYDEVENLGNQIYEHRISFCPEGELTFQFSEVEVKRFPRSNRERAERPIFRENV